MNTILIPVDFSESTEVSLKYALQFTNATKNTLFLFHIYADQLMIPDSSFPTGIDSDSLLNTEFIMELRKQAELNMEKLVEDLKSIIRKTDAKNIAVESFVTGGDPEWEINEICQKLEPTLIIMGTRGDGKKGFLEGSMAEKIMEKACRPVLAVPTTTSELRLKNVMYATNFSEQDFTNVGLIFRLFAHLKISIHIVHFNLKEAKSGEKVLMDTLKQALINTYPEGNFTFNMIDGNEKSDVLKAFTTEYKIDLISFIAHKSNIFKNLFSHSIHKKDFFKLELPMLAIHA